MTKEQKAVRAFMLKAMQQCPKKAGFPEAKIQMLREALIWEESDEFCDANRDADIIEVADALGDLLYVVLGAAVAYGIDLEPVFWEIHRSNMSKFRKGFQIRKDGKLLKSPKYSPANLGPILEAQK